MCSRSDAKPLGAKTFAAVMTAATELDPFGKRLSDQTVAMAYMTLPDVVKNSVTDEMFVYALKQHQLQPAERSELTLLQQLLQHVFCCENGAPNYRWGLKKDLPNRMANSGVLHGQPKSAYELGEDLSTPEPRFAPNGVLAQLAGWADE